MKGNARKAILLATFTILLVHFEGLALKPGCNNDQLRACGSDFLVYGSVTRLPEQRKEFQDHCERITRQLSCALNFTNTCEEGLPRVAAILGIQAIDEAYEAICTEGSDHNEMYHKSIKCLNTIGVMLNACQNTMREDLEKAVSSAQKERMIYYGCCAFHKDLDCFDASMDVCSKTPAKEFVNDIMDKTFGGVLGLVCGQYTRGSTACQELPDLSAAVNSKDLGKKDIFELVIDIGESFVNKS